MQVIDLMRLLVKCESDAEVVLWQVEAEGTELLEYPVADYQITPTGDLALSSEEIDGP